MRFARETLQNAEKARQNKNALPAVGTRVKAYSDGYGGFGTVTEHTTNLLGLPLVLVKLDGDDNKEACFYGHEVQEVK